MAGLSVRIIIAFLSVDAFFRPLFWYAVIVSMRIESPREELRVFTAVAAVSLPSIVAWILVVRRHLRPIERWQGRSDDDALTIEAGEAADRAPGFIALAWMTQAVALVVSLGALLAGPLHAATSPDTLALFGFVLAAVTLGTLIQAHTLASWLLADVASHIATVANERGLVLRAGGLSVRQRLSLVCFCTAVAPAASFAGLAYVSLHGAGAPFEAFNTALAVNLLGAAVFALLCAWWLAAAFTAPVARMHAVIAGITQRGDFSAIERLPVQRRDEVGALAEEVNRMIERLEGVWRERAEIAELLEALNQSLESRVERRTADLHGSNRTLTRKTRALEQAVAAVRYSEALKAAIVERASDAIVTYDERGTIHDWNAAAEQMFGYFREEMIGRSIGLVGPGGAVLPTGGAPRHEFAARAKDGRTVLVEVSRSAIPRGDVQLTIALVRDLTEVKRREAEVDAMQQRLVRASREAGMAQVATTVLHNVGNVLNSVNVSAAVATDGLRAFELNGLARAAALLRADAGDRPRLVQLAAYLDDLRGVVHRERDRTLCELAGLRKNIEHIATIVAMQQSMARPCRIREAVAVPDVVDAALQMVRPSLVGNRIEVVSDFGDVPPALLDRRKAMDILVNLLSNARDALIGSGPELQRRITIRLREARGMVLCEVIDNGVGIAPADHARVFEHGFTTKPQGHGFGLHASALFATELGGSLTCRSEGPGKGAVFGLELPCAMELPTTALLAG